MPRRCLAAALLLGLSALAGCKAEPRDGAAPEAAVAVLAAPGAVVVAPVPPPSVGPVNYGTSVAFFTDDRLDQCIGNYVTPPPGGEAAAREAVEKRANETAEKVKAWSGSDKPLLLSKTCAEQFSDRPILATCVNQSESKLGRVKIEVYYFDMRTLDKSDTEMKACISKAGDWRPNPDKSVVARARLGEKQRKLEKMIGDAEKTAAAYEP